MANLADPKEIHHPDSGETATVTAKSVPMWKERGWKTGPLPQKKPATGESNPTKPPAGDKS